MTDNIACEEEDAYTALRIAEKRLKNQYDLATALSTVQR